MDYSIEDDRTPQQVAKDRADLIAANPHLTPYDGSKDPLILGAKNLRAELKKSGIKASVHLERFSGGDSLSVYVLDPDRVPEAETMTNKYCDRHFDGQDDTTYSTATDWTEIFGSTSHSRAYQATGDEAEKLLGTYKAPAKVPLTLHEIERKFLTAAERGTASVVAKWLPTIQEQSSPGTFGTLGVAWRLATNAMRSNWGGAFRALAANADPNFDIFHDTPLHYAVQNSNMDKAVENMLRNGAKVDARDDKGCTPLFRSVSVRNTQLLLEAGADFNAKNNSGQAPQSSNPEIQAILEAARNLGALGELAKQTRSNAGVELASPEEVMAQQSRGRFM